MSASTIGRETDANANLLPFNQIAELAVREVIILFYVRAGSIGLFEWFALGKRRRKRGDELIVTPETLFIIY